MEAYALNIWCFFSTRIVSCMLSVDFSLFSRFTFRSNEWRMLRRMLWINYKGILTTSWNWGFKVHFMGRNHQIFLFFLFLRCFRWFDAFRSIMSLQIIWWVLTANVIGKPDTLSLNMPLDLYLWNEPHMGDTVCLPISLLV